MTTNDNKTTAYIVRLPEGRIYEMVRILRTMDRWISQPQEPERETVTTLTDSLDNAQNLSERCESEAKEWEGAQSKYAADKIDIKDAWAEGCKHKAKALREFAKLF